MPTYQVTIDGNEYTVSVPNPHERPVRAIVNGKTIEVTIENNTTKAVAISSTSTSSTDNIEREPVVHRQPSLAISPKTVGSTSDVNSPLPGTIVSISVAEGDQVAPGQELCVLEAMKMNNPIRSTVSGTVTKIYITVGQQVQHGVPLMNIEE